jgi:ribonuclease HII
MSAFPEAELQVLAEGPESSRYRLTDVGGAMEVRYEVGGEDRHLPTALASMVCKYVRELMMDLFNRWWAARVPGLEPTAGYATDAKRFIAAVSAAAAEADLPDGLWIRCR